LFRLECVDCASKVETDALDPTCPRCKSAGLIRIGGLADLRRSDLESLPPGVWRYASTLPAVSRSCIVSLGEGGTPLLHGKRLGQELAAENLMIKDETRNPTGSFIDRGSTILVSLAKERGITKVSCTTTGNFGASLAAYCAKAGIETEVRVTPRVDRGKLYQIIAYGAKIEVAPGPTRDPPSQPRTIVASAWNPFIVEGEKTTGFEIVQELAWKQPDVIVLPVGTGGHLTVVWRALGQLLEAGLVDAPRTRLVGVQLRASAPIVGELQLRRRPGHSEGPLTELEESEPIFKRSAIAAIKESGGTGIEVSSREALHATSLLARTEGIFAEPAASSVVAAVAKMRSERIIDHDELVVCVITGTGLKDTKAIARTLRGPRRMPAIEGAAFRPLRAGSTKVRLLEGLERGPRFGYDLWKYLQSSQSITTASVYQHLAEMEDAAVVRRSRVAAVKGRERVYYELTAKGTELLGIIRSTRKAGLTAR
jgi:threonine synthase